MLTIVKLDYDFFQVINADYLQHSGSCIKHLTTELADVYQPYGGLPESYTIKNTLIHQLWWDRDQVDYNEIGRQLGMEVVTVSTICQPPGNVIPWHSDTFYQIKQKYPDRTETKVRANIHLEDWKMGHFIQYNDEVRTHWKAGTGIMWDSSILHLGANAGLENKYTMQVSGFLKE